LQLQAYNSNYAALNAVAAAAGRTIPSISSTSVWSSSQYNAASAYSLDSGGVNSSNKGSYVSVLVGYDL
jgi:hypothetical protein